MDLEIFTTKEDGNRIMDCHNAPQLSVGGKALMYSVHIIIGYYVIIIFRQRG